MKKENKGFTLAELLIAVAIIAVLVAIAIPIFTAQLEKSREATDLANVRGAYAQVMAAAIAEDQSGTQVNYDEGEKTYYLEVPLHQKKDGWTSSTEKMVVGGIPHSDDEHWLNDPAANGSCKVYFQQTGEGAEISYAMYLDWGGEGKSESSPVIPYYGTTQTRAGFAWSATNGLMSVVPRSSRTSLTMSPLKLEEGASITLSADSGYDAAIFVMKYVEGQGFVQVTDGKWVNGSKGISEYTSTDDNTYIVVNAKRTDEAALTTEEAEAHTSFTVTGNTTPSTAGLTGKTVDQSSAQVGKGISNLNADGSSNSGKTGGTAIVTDYNKRGTTSQSVSKGSVISVTGNEDYNLAFFLVDSSNKILYDSGWFGNGTSTAMEVPEDSTLIVQTEGSSNKMTQDMLKKALDSVTVYSK